ncbi:MAG TPA: hypothetical protein VLX58_05230 [Bryobacteraceae bacterium]|nr:hypothetical protein [Bryobacteraceae bacterium]
MNAVLLGAAILLVLLGVGFGMLFARLLSRDRDLPALEDWEEIFSPARYKAMERLLEETDYQYLASKSANNQKLEKQLRAKRVRIFSAYVSCLSRDFTRICNAIKKMMVDSRVDRPDLAGLLMKQHFIFTITVLSIEVRLVLYNFGMGAPDGRSLIDALETMSSQLRTLSLVIDPAA